ncbi:MAG: DinB family protein [bacterium]
MNDQIQLLKWMLEDVRKETLEGVKHLTKEQLFLNPLEGEFPIGAYLLHFAEVDIYWLEVLSGNEQPDDLKRKAYSDNWFDPSGKGAPPIEPLEINEYMETIAMARKNFLDYVLTLKDSDLEENVIRESKSGERKILKKWIIYHILEHEAHHRGQMFMLIRKAGWNKKK